MKIFYKRPGKRGNSGLWNLRIGKNREFTIG